ncbi:hypothetical protein SDC9_195414 [bioreactor metagenome]|uniref:Type II secretion system protein GspF domain-containing protein n=1 Tax=bioreactor metagenome TaxID=1076179 RepID=A0A645I9N3_9ZZZZ
MEDALAHIRQQTNNELSQEIADLHEQLQSGRPKKDAFKDLFERSNVLEIKLFAMTMIQAEQYRISASETLKAQAAKLHDEIKDLLAEEAQPEKINFVTPIVLFVTPLLFIALFVFSITNLI